MPSESPVSAPLDGPRIDKLLAIAALEMGWTAERLSGEAKNPAHPEDKRAMYAEGAERAAAHAKDLDAFASRVPGLLADAALLDRMINSLSDVPRASVLVIHRELTDDRDVLFAARLGISGAWTEAPTAREALSRALPEGGL